MKIASIFLAAVMVTAMAGTAVEARDHDGWRHHQQRAWRNYNKQFRHNQNRYWNNNRGYYGWNRVQRPNGRPWDNAYDNAMRAEAAIRAEQQAQRGFFWY
ncbi:MAG TPA: hypothetical protein PKZ32_15070 [Candidatus Melainabacteria bacterium]|nr:hypothetical protein [Candidatus Melainabacteria bacterium]